VALLAFGAWLARRTRAEIRSAVRVPGRVVDLVRRGRPGHHTWSPVVEYAYEGATRSFTSSFSSKPPAWKPGDDLTVLVQPDVPGEARIDSFGALWLLPMLCAAFGLLLVAAGFGIGLAG
jgi:hypothetical protein